MSKASLPFSSLEHFQALMSRCPFNRWLQLQAKAVGPEGVDIAMPWRDELMSSPEAQSMHGGVLASLIDAAASYSVAVHVGRGIPTVDLRIDYHKVAKPGDYLAKGRAIQIGRTLSFGEAQVYDARGVLVASGRGVFLTRTAG
jgi:uncharacterized protein (TIGR00369 family)